MKIRKLHDLPYNKHLKERARELRKARNIHEVKFWLEVRNKQFLGLDFDRQRIIGSYIVDFYCHKHSLIIEIDGSIHDKTQEYDHERDNYLKSLGLKIIHIKTQEIELNMKGVLAKIKEFIKNNKTKDSTTPP